jgi:hypothetical protein
MKSKEEEKKELCDGCKRARQTQDYDSVYTCNCNVDKSNV